MDPYEILSLEKNATYDEIKEQYNNLLEEYTRNQDENTEKNIQSLNDAYKMIMNGYIYKEIRDFIQNRNFTAAEAKLNIYNDRECGEWNYLQGFIAVQKGWFETGLNYLKRAVEIDPNNTEYLSSLNTLHSRVIEYATKYAKQNVTPNSNNMNACSGNDNGGMC